VDRAGRTPQLSAYWSPYFPAPATLPGYVSTRMDQLRPVLGVGWPLFVGLGVLGVITVGRLRRPATATALVLLPMIVIVAGVMRLYPLLDQRTSHFLLVTGAVLAAVGVVGTAAAITSAIARSGGSLDRLPGYGRAAAAGGIVLLALVSFAVANRGTLLHPPLPGKPQEDIRAQVAYVAAHRGPGDTVLVNLSGQYGFAYYWPEGEPQLHRGGVQATGFYVDYRPADRVVVAADRDQVSIVRAVAAADDLSGAGGRIWLVRTHVNDAEAAAWQRALAGRQVRLIEVGPEPVAVITAD
jgi:hypothetical protein